MALALAANVFYPEDELVDELGFTRRWLRRHVGGQRANKKRVYRGADVLAKLEPCPPTALKSTHEKVRPVGGRVAMSKAKAEKITAGQQELKSEPTNVSLREKLKEMRRRAPLPSPLKFTDKK